MDDQRDDLQPRRAAGAGSRRVEELRRHDDFRHPLSAGARSSPVRGRCWSISTAARTTRERVASSGRSNYFLNELGVAHHLSRTCAARPASAASSAARRRQAARRRGQGHRRAARLDRGAARPRQEPRRAAGASYGGWLALEAGIAYNDRIRGIIEGAGITDFVTFLEQTDPARQENRRQEYGDERDPADARVPEVDLAGHARRGAQEADASSCTRARTRACRSARRSELLKALKANNAHVWYAEFADANHDNFPDAARTTTGCSRRGCGSSRRSSLN